MTRLTQMVARFVLLPTFMVAMAFLVKGYQTAGDGFSAGVLAATAVLLHYVVFGHRAAAAEIRIAPVGVTAGLVGLLVMLGVTLRGTLAGGPLLVHLPPPGGHVRTLLGIELHTAVLFDVGIGLLVSGTLVSIIELLAETAEEEA